MHPLVHNTALRLALLSLFLVCRVTALQAQATSFTYQGKLTDAGSPAAGTYDLQFRLYDALSAGNQVGSTLDVGDVAVSNGLFAVMLDFGGSAFPGPDRFLEIWVRPGTSTSTHAVLSPRQPLTSAPYSIRSLSAASADGLSLACVSCVTSSQINTVNGNQITGTIPAASVPADSAEYIQNKTTTQANSNFNVSGNGVAGGTLSANAVNATALFSLNGNRALSVSGGTPYQNSNTFAGVDAGTATTPTATPSGNLNSFFGMSAGRLNTTGGENSFFGANAGHANLTGQGNSYFGDYAGNSNTGGHNNSFFGSGAGYSNTAIGNSFFGQQSGNSNSTGTRNSFFGLQAGIATTAGGFNSFFGASAGATNTMGSGNTLIGNSANAGLNNLTNATALGANALVSQSNSLVLGSINGVNGAAAGTNVGIGTSTPAARLHVAGGDLLFENKWRTEGTTVSPGPVAGTPNLIGGFLGTGSTGPTPGNRATAGVVGATIAGGGFNGSVTFPSGNSLIGDNSNRVTDWFGTVGGGWKNIAGNDTGALDDAKFSTVSGGLGNTASKDSATVGGGTTNIASGSWATVGGGLSNTASGLVAAVAGGNGNTASGQWSAVPGGLGNTAVGNYSFAAGRQAEANHDGAFVWADSSNSAAFTSTGTHQFLIRASGGVGIGTANPITQLHVSSSAVQSTSFMLEDLSGGSSRQVILSNYGSTGGGSYWPGLNSAYTSSLLGPNLFVLRATGGLAFSGSSTAEHMRITLNGTVQPGSDNTQDFGGGGLRWKAIFAANGTIQTSDARLKKNITPLGYGLREVLQLRPVSFLWKDQSEGRSHLGFLAQDVEKLIPEAVDRDKSPDTPLGMNYASLTPVVIKAIQEQQEEITSLKNETARLTQLNAELEARLARLEKMAR